MPIKLTLTNLLRILIAFIIVLSACKKQEKPQGDNPLLSSDKGIEKLWFDKAKNPHLFESITGTLKNDTIYVHAVAGTRIDSLVADFIYKGNGITVTNTQQTTGLNVNNFTNNLQYTVTADDGSKKNYVVKFTSSGLPAIYISTNNIPIVSKEEYLNASFKIVKGIDAEVLINTTTEIKGRGNSTWNLAKKPYRIKLNKKTSLLNMPENKHWVLLANHADKSLMRNELAFELSRRVGLAYTPRSRFVEVVLNGAYIGNYQLVEQIKVDKDRVNVEEQDENASSEPEITGGYMLEIDGFAATEPVHFFTTRNIPVTVKYPDEDVINQTQKDYIKNHFQKFENALMSDDFTDPATGYRKYFDMDSYVNYYIVNEIMGNPDMFWSTYVYKKRGDDKLYTGPIWDFDISLNNDARLGNAVNKLMLTAAHEPKIYINRLMMDPAFRQAIKNRWNELKPNVIDKLPNVAVEIAKMLGISQVKNFTVWDVLNRRVYLENYLGGTYPKEAEQVYKNLTDRINWLDAKFNGDEYR